MSAQAPPLTVVAKGLVGKVIHVFAQGGHRFTGRLVKVADDGQALRLTNQPTGADAPIHFYIDLDQIVALSLKEEA